MTNPDFSGFSFRNKDIIKWRTTNGTSTQGLVMDPLVEEGKLLVRRYPNTHVDDGRCYRIKKTRIIKVTRDGKEVTL